MVKQMKAKIKEVEADVVDEQKMKSYIRLVVIEPERNSDHTVGISSTTTTSNAKISKVYLKSILNCAKHSKGLHSPVVKTSLSDEEGS